MSAMTGRGALNHMSCSNIAEYLSKLGVSAIGVNAVREHQVDGEVFTELTDNDIKDLFSIFKDRHLVRKILQGKDNNPVQTHPIKTKDIPTPEPIRVQKTANSHVSESIRNVRSDSGFGSYAAGTKDNVLSEEQFHLIRSFEKLTDTTGACYRADVNTYQGLCKNPHGTSIHDNQTETQTHHVPMALSYSKSVTEPLKHFTFIQNSSTRDSLPHHLKPQNLSQDGSSKASTKASTIGTDYREYPRQSSHAALSHFIQSKSRLAAENESHVPADLSQSNRHQSPFQAEHELTDSKFIPSVLTHRLTQFSGLDLLSRKAKQGKPSEAQRLGQMVVREASSRAGIWDDPPCLQLLTTMQKEMFFEYSFYMAPNLREFKDLLWKRLGEALLNRRKYLRDKVLGKRGKRLDEQSASSDVDVIDLDYCDSPEPAEDFEDQVPDTSTSSSQSDRARKPPNWNNGPSSTQSRPDVSDNQVPMMYNTAEDEDRQTYPDSTMDTQNSGESEADHKQQMVRENEEVFRRKRSALDCSSSSSQNLSLLSSAACSALKEEAEIRYRTEIKRQRYSEDFSMVDFEDGQVDTRCDPPADIEKVNLHKRLFMSKSDSRHHHIRTGPVQYDSHIDRKPVGLFEPPLQTSCDEQQSSNFIMRTDQESDDAVSNEDLENSGMWDSFVMEEVPEMRIYSTIDRGIAQYTGEELLTKKSKQGKPSEPQRLGQQVIRESAMMAKLWQDVPQSIRAISEHQKKVFYQCAFTLAPNLVPFRDMLWRRLGEALQNRRKYVRDRRLGKRPTKREQRIMNESLSQQESESDSQASLSSIQDIENIVRVKSENPHH
ncbi:uncharacterized protein [Haliotis cracherodii]|uniref:uncharacterized protein n=1 Tax=Haliotis cracherodii TaxID=6455 RepID=UPI0039ECECE5